MKKAQTRHLKLLPVARDPAQLALVGSEEVELDDHRVVGVVQRPFSLRWSGNAAREVSK